MARSLITKCRPLYLAHLITSYIQQLQSFYTHAYQALRFEDHDNLLWRIRKEVDNIGLRMVQDNEYYALEKLEVMKNNQVEKTHSMVENIRIRILHFENYYKVANH